VKNIGYLKNHKIDHVDDFLGYMRVRRYDISCHKVVNTGLTFKNPNTGKKISKPDIKLSKTML
jgi:hypothetical protein